MLKAFTFCALGKNFEPGGRLEGAPVQCSLKGSMDGNQWVDLKIGVVLRNGPNRNFKLYKVINPDHYKKYRFYLVNEGPPQPMLISAIHMVPDI